MSWNIDYTGNTNSFREVSDKKFENRPRDSSVRTLTKELREVMPEDDPVGTKVKIGKGSYGLLKELRDHYGDNALVSFKDLRIYIKARLGYNNRVLAKMLNLLWRNGFLRKFAAGEYGQGWRGKNKGLVGRYHGVHYLIIER